MSDIYLQLEDQDGNIYSFPRQFKLSDDSVDTMKNIVNNTYAPGGKNIGDGFLLTRNIVVEGDLFAPTQSEIETILRNISLALLKCGKLKIHDDYVSRYIEVSAPFMQSVWINFPHHKQVIITFLAEFPFWLDETQTVDTNAVAGNDTLTITVTGSDYLVYPIIEIENDQGVDNPGVKMVNRNDGAMTFEYNDATFLDGDLLIIDCLAGTVKKNGNDAIEYFNPARFLRLQPQANTIEYEGAACTIRFKYRKAYLL